MRTFLAFISLLLAQCLMLNAQTADSICERMYNLYIQARGHEITGLCVMNISPDGDVVGTIVNEFGVKAFDFTREQGKVKIMNVISPLDKWYIRRVLRRDFRHILSDMKQLDCGATIRRKSRTYTFTPIKTEE